MQVDETRPSCFPAESGDLLVALHKSIAIIEYKTLGEEDLGVPASLLGRENGAKPRLAAHHPIVGLRGALQREDLGHGAYPG